MNIQISKCDPYREKFLLTERDRGVNHIRTETFCIQLFAIEITLKWDRSVSKKFQCSMHVAPEFMYCSGVARGGSKGA